MSIPGPEFAKSAGVPNPVDHPLSPPSSEDIGEATDQIERGATRILPRVMPQREPPNLAQG